MKETELWVGPTVDDSKWERRDIGIWYGTKYPDTTKGVFRRKFTVPDTWNDKGQTWLWMYRSTGPISPAPYQNKVFLDGEQVFDGKGWLYGTCVLNLTDKLTPGEHQLTVTSQSISPVGGIAGNVWLEHVTEPQSRQSLEGDWNGAQLPGTTKPPMGEIRREFTPDKAMLEGKRALLYVEATQNNILGVIVNGRILNRDQGGQHFSMDLTPYLRANQPNTLTLTPQYSGHPTAIKTVEMRYYQPGTY